MVFYRGMALINLAGPRAQVAIHILTKFFGRKDFALLPLLPSGSRPLSGVPALNL